MTTVRCGSPPGVSAITLTLSASCSRTSVLTRATVPASLRSTPTANDVPTPGMWTPWAPKGEVVGNRGSTRLTLVEQDEGGGPRRLGIRGLHDVCAGPAGSERCSQGRNRRSPPAHTRWSTRSGPGGREDQVDPLDGRRHVAGSGERDEVPVERRSGPGHEDLGLGAVSCSTGGEASVNDSTNVNSSRLTSYPAASALFTTYATEAS